MRTFWKRRCRGRYWRAGGESPQGGLSWTGACGLSFAGEGLGRGGTAIVSGRDPLDPLFHLCPRYHPHDLGSYSELGCPPLGLVMLNPVFLQGHGSQASQLLSSSPPPVDTS